jgi:ABC-type nitrate/sulfonate/bicarbonate transport system permease component
MIGSQTTGDPVAIAVITIAELILVSAVRIVEKRVLHWPKELREER